MELANFKFCLSVEVVEILRRLTDYKLHVYGIRELGRTFLDFWPEFYQSLIGVRT